MSINLSIKDVPDDIAERLRQRAARNHRSLQGELMAIVERAAAEAEVRTEGLSPRRPAARGWKSVDDVAAAARQRFAGGTPGSVDLIRQMRDARCGDDRERGVDR